jgi:LPS O-antigen subunit length determinant protein (WzzB/FepE family)
MSEVQKDAVGVRWIHYAVLGTSAVITAHNGETRSEFGAEDVVGQIVANVDDVADVLLTAGGEEKSFKAYGINSLLQDRSSQAKGQSEKFEYMQAEWQRLCADGATWSATKEVVAKAPKAPKVDSLLAAAIAELKGVSVTVASVMLGKLDKDRLAAIAASDAVKAKVAELKAQADEAEGLDLSDLLG